MEYSTKEAGTLYEQLFIVESLRRGLQPHTPVGDFLPHDLVVYGSNGICYRVQIKGTSTEARHSKRPNQRGRYRITAAYGSKSKTLIDCNQTDILACYVAPWDLWYIIPCEKVRSVCVWLYPDPQIKKRKRTGTYEQYKNNWDIFT
tara:strand:- start:619 stop:1056 length:438 start_codon:yes stop_codon:yes gene_type:complete